MANRGFNRDVIGMLLKAFEYGVDYGQFLAETERDSEMLFDATCCMTYSRKCNVSSNLALRRQPHSDKWRRIKRDAQLRFIELLERNSND